MDESKEKRIQSARLAYFNREGSLAELSIRFEIPKRTLERRSSKEGWRQAIERAGGTVAALAGEVAVKTAQAQGEALGRSAGAFLERVTGQTWTFLDKLDELARSEAITPDTLLKLTQAHRHAVNVGRQAYGLDREQHSSSVSFMAYLVRFQEGQGDGAVDKSKCRPGDVMSV